jgi:hypothetical protein
MVLVMAGMLVMAGLLVIAGMLWVAGMLGVRVWRAVPLVMSLVLFLHLRA